MSVHSAVHAFAGSRQGSPSGKQIGSSHSTQSKYQGPQSSYKGPPGPSGAVMVQSCSQCSIYGYSQMSSSVLAFALSTGCLVTLIFFTALPPVILNTKRISPLIFLYNKYPLKSSSSFVIWLWLASPLCLLKYSSSGT